MLRIAKFLSILTAACLIVTALGPDAVAQDAVTQNAAPQEPMVQNTVAQDTIVQDTIIQDTIVQDAAPLPSTTVGNGADQGAIAQESESFRQFPPPATVSPQMAEFIAAPAPENWSKRPRNAEEWKALRDSFSQAVTPDLPMLRDAMGVSVRSGTMAGVRIFTVTPKTLPPENAERVLLHFHGGGYVFGAGESGTSEAILMSGLGGFKVISVDYRLAPEFPYPAALDDALAVYRELTKNTPPESVGVFGTSTGGGLSLALLYRLRAEGLALPAAVAAGTPWADLTKTGDTYFTNEHVDNILVSYDGWLGEAATVYAAGHDMQDPMLSPVYGDVVGFPPIFLTSGSRDLFLSNTVRMHLKLRQAGVDADLVVFEGQSHAQYGMALTAPETRFHFSELGRFFRKHLQ